MNCHQARRLFGACWDDETTQAERDWLEAHFAACAPCRTEYEAFSRALELAASLPREEASADLVDRVVARARRLAPAPDRVALPGRRWVPITAAAALLAIVGILAAPWTGLRSPVVPSSTAVIEPVSVPQLRVTPTASAHSRETAGAPAATGRPIAPTATASLTDIPDSLFDHSEDVEFILDPVTLRHGRASVTRNPVRTLQVQGEQATITF
jgi:anti-sigma factor RsiW